jgi:hypothetical protein
MMMQPPARQPAWSPAPRAQAALTYGTPSREPDLHSQLEELLNEVWAAEANWRFDDRLDLALKARRS